mgnify:CR=1 FL=1
MYENCYIAANTLYSNTVDDNILSYIQIGGKIIYNETDLMIVLEQNLLTKK